MTQKLVAGTRVLSYDDLDRHVAQAIGGFKALGIGRGDSVALLIRNDFPFFEATLAAGALGAYPVPVNWHYTADEAGYVLRDCDAKAVLVHADLLPRIGSAIPDGVTVLGVETPAEIATAYGVSAKDARLPQGMRNWDAWRAAQSPGKAETEPPGSMIYTSGTTGKPKGVRRNPPTDAQIKLIAAARPRFLRITSPNDVALITGPMYHSAPNAFCSLALRTRCSIILQPRFDPEETLALIERHRVTHMHVVPTMFIRFLRLPEEVRRKYDLSSLREVPHGAAPCPPEIKRAMIAWWGNVIGEYYGGTESSGVTYCLAPDWLAHPGTVGQALPNCHIRVLDDDGRDVPRGQSGEIFLRNDNIPDFTYHKDDAKRRASERDGFISIGDVGYLDADGFLYLNDRKRDMIISGGANIYPAEIEAVLHLYPGIADCAVFGIPDAEFGEQVCAVIQPRPGIALDAEEIKRFLSTRIAKYMVPKRIEFRSDLPREDSGKIFKRKLREPYWEGAGRRI